MSYDKVQAVGQFGRWSARYDRSVLQRLLFGPSHQVLIDCIQNRFPDQPVSILDVGCGTGVFAARVRAALPRSRVWGVDLVAAMLARGRIRWQADREHVAAIQGESERLPFPAGSFDVVTCANSFHHYPNQARAVAEMHRVLKPGGRLLLIDGYRDRPWGWFIYDVCVAAVEGEVRHLSASGFRALFDAAGFAGRIQSIHHGVAPFLLTEGIAGPTRTAATEFDRTAIGEAALLLSGATVS